MLNPKLRYNNKSFPALDGLQDIYALVIYNTNLSTERQEDNFPTYPYLNNMSERKC